MKTILPLVFGTALGFVTLLTGGCALIPSPYARQLKPARELYRTVERGDTREDLVSFLGSPTREDLGGSAVWETRFDALNYAYVQVWFDASDVAEKVTITQAHGSSGPHHELSAKTTRVQ